jgi:hypothetical protein
MTTTVMLGEIVSIIWWLVSFFITYSIVEILQEKTEFVSMILGWGLVFRVLVHLVIWGSLSLLGDLVISFIFALFQSPVEEVIDVTLLGLAKRLKAPDNYFLMY